jgi:hypothetical protein
MDTCSVRSISDGVGELPQPGNQNERANVGVTARRSLRLPGVPLSLPTAAVASPHAWARYTPCPPFSENQPGQWLGANDLFAGTSALFDALGVLQLSSAACVTLATQARQRFKRQQALDGRNRAAVMLI